ncbi:MAG: sortase [Butyrivibrio sp.]|nr:sortase [Butyrivibrio sp.]
MNKIKGFVFIIIGLVFIGIAGVIVYNNQSESQAAADASESDLECVLEQMPQTVLDATYEGDMPVADVDGRSYIGTVEIPSLGLLLPIQSEWGSDNAKISVCRYLGSVYDNDLIIAGHNYVEHFGNLNQLSTGDEVIVTDMNGRSFYYQVSNIETLGSYDIEEMEEGDWDLTLFTCTVGGASRVTVRCEATGETSEVGDVPDIQKAVEESEHVRK